jgi:tetratricopeptide (TPR) repeat protein
MLNKNMTKVEIERELRNQGDYVQIDNITRFLKQNPPLDIKKFLYAFLIEIYNKRKMFAEAAEVCGRLAEIMLNSDEKIVCLRKETEFFIKAGFFDKADIVFRRIMGEVRANDRPKINLEIREFYKTQAENYEKEKRRSLAVKTYEKILTLDISDFEKSEVNKKLTELYKELGMVGQYMKLKAKNNLS